MGKLSRLLCAAALAWALCACSAQVAPTPSATPEPTPTPEAVEFSLPCYTDVSLHPITGQSRTNQTLSALVYEGLFSVDKRFAAQPVLAGEWSESEDGLIWRIALAEAAFSDGSPVTAAEAAFSLELARQSGLYAARLSDVRKVRAEGEELVITLERPNRNLPVLLDIPIVKEVGKGEPPLGTGRYAYAGEGENLYLKRQEKAPANLPETISLTHVRGTDDLIYGFDTKEISLVVADLTGTEALGYSGGYEAWDFPTTDMIYLGFNTAKNSPCEENALRQAISLALDRETVATALFSRHVRAAVLPVVPESSLYDERLAEALAYSPRAAEELLTGAGYKLEEGQLVYRRKAVELELLVNTDNSFKLAAADFLAGEMEKLGITVTVVKLSWQDYIQRLEKGEFDLYLAETLLRCDFDLSELVGSGGSLNYGGWNNEETDGLLEQFRTVGGGAHPAVAKDLYEHLAEQMPITPVCFKNQSVLTQWGQMTGLTPLRGDPFAGDHWSISLR